MNPISKERFDALTHKCHPYKILICVEIAWFESKNNKILGTITFDLNDKNYGFVLLGRNERNLFSYIDSKHGFALAEEAFQKMEIFAQSYEVDSLTFYPDDQEEFDSYEILEQKISNEDQHKFFRRLLNGDEYEAARNLIKEIGCSFKDADGNFINTFQSIDVFNARLFELYLFQYFKNANFIIDKDYNIPDFCLSYFGNSYFVEATTVNAGEINASNPRTVEEMQELWLDYMPIKFSSPLLRKLKKRYWEKEHVKGHPFIVAIHDYHQEGSNEGLGLGLGLGSMSWSGPCLQDYLYGVREDISDTHPIDYHEFNGKKYDQVSLNYKMLNT